MLIKQDLALSKIIDHPINASIYRDNFDDELVESVRQNDKQPEYRGTITLEDGTKLELSAWVKESKNGEKFFSGTVREPYRKPEETPPPPPSSAAAAADDCPF